MTLRAWLVAGSLLAVPVSAHDLEFTFVVATFRADGGYTVDITCDLDALALGVPPGSDSAEVVRRLQALPLDALEARLSVLRERLPELVLLRFDGHRAAPAVDFPEYGRVEDAPVPTLVGLTARFDGRVPEGATFVTFEGVPRLPPVYLTLLDEAGSNVVHEVLVPGRESDPLRLAPGTPPTRSSTARVAWRYFQLGVWHIVPEGLDHVLFVLGLFLLSARLRPLLLQVSAFTAAHTVTLALASYGVVRLSPSVVEPLIALSIAYVAVENVVTRELTPWRPVVVFGFGLLHGLGFAGVLGELGLPAGELLPALLSFNLGVEAGQLLVLASAFATIGRFRHRSWYRRGVTVPLSALIALVGLYWAAERVLGG